MTSIFVVATNGTGLYYREILDTDTTVYCDREVAGFDTELEAVEFCNEHDEDYWHYMP